jgi:ABC-type multidrug transport system ATPase subunit
MEPKEAVKSITFEG